MGDGSLREKTRQMAPLAPVYDRLPPFTAVFRGKSNVCLGGNGGQRGLSLVAWGYRGLEAFGKR
jgi:hypothetical protein